MGLTRMESVYCDFTKLPGDAGKYFRFSQIIQLQISNFNSIINLKGFQKWIGYVDVKSAPVYFYVQRNSWFNTTYTPIPFDLARVNEGNVMDLTSGKFTAPRPGIYFFSFTGVVGLSVSSSYVYFFSNLYLNGNRIGSSYIEDNATNNAPVDQRSPMSFQSTLNLKKGDQLWVVIYCSEYSNSSSYLYDSNDYHFTHFTGFMLEEEIAASLWGLRFKIQKCANERRHENFGEGNFKGEGK